MSDSPKVTLIDILANALSILAEGSPDREARALAALAADRQELGRRVTALRRAKDAADDLDRLFHRIWVSTLWVLLDDLARWPTIDRTDEAALRHHYAAWRTDDLRDPRRAAVVRARAAEDRSIALAWDDLDAMLVPAGTVSPTLDADIVAALVAVAMRAYDDGPARGSIVAAVIGGWTNGDRDRCDLLTVASVALILHLHENARALRAIEALLDSDGAGTGPETDGSFTRLVAEAAGKRQMQFRLSEFDWCISGWEAPAAASGFAFVPLIAEDIYPHASKVARAFESPEAALHAIVRHGVARGFLTTPGHADQALRQRAVNLRDLLAELRSTPNFDPESEAGPGAAYRAISAGDFEAAEREMSRAIAQIEAQPPASSASNRHPLRILLKLRANLATLRFDWVTAAGDYRRCAELFSGENPEHEFYARLAQASSLSSQSATGNDLDGLHQAIALWRNEIPALAAGIAAREATIDANGGLGQALDMLTDLTGDPVPRAEAAPALRAALIVDRLLAIDGRHRIRSRRDWQRPIRLSARINANTPACWRRASLVLPSTSPKLFWTRPTPWWSRCWETSRARNIRRYGAGRRISQPRSISRVAGPDWKTAICRASSRIWPRHARQ